MCRRAVEGIFDYQRLSSLSESALVFLSNSMWLLYLLMFNVQLMMAWLLCSLSLQLTLLMVVTLYSSNPSMPV